jgi:hypothetical protein
LPPSSPGPQMARKRLTDRGLKALRPADPGTRYEIMDTDAPGLESVSRIKGDARSSYSLGIRGAPIPPGGHLASTTASALNKLVGRLVSGKS